MGYRFRTPGPWGPGEAEDLPPEAVDGNFWQAIQDIQAKAAQGVGISNATVAGDQFYLVLTDHTLLGPYTLPKMTIQFQGEWAPNTNYLAGDIITHGGSTYFVNVNHTSAATFDPGANDGHGNNFYGLLLQNPALTVPTGGQTDWVLGKVDGTDFNMSWRKSGLPRGGVAGQLIGKLSSTDFDYGLVTPGATTGIQNISSTTIHPTLSYAGSYNRCLASSPVSVIIPHNSQVPFAIGTSMKWRQCTNAGIISIYPDVLSPNTVLINPISGHLDTTARQGAVIETLKVDTDEWDLFGYVGVHA